MKFFILFFLSYSSFFSNGQTCIPCNTAKDCMYMTIEEREMIYEINRVRSDPQSYLQYLIPMLDEARKNLKVDGKGQKNYSLTIKGSSANGDPGSIDTTWNYENEEQVKALISLITDLKTIKKASILLPDPGIYKAVVKHAADNEAHNWELMHTGSDGSEPWDRIKHFSPLMRSGGENIAGHYGYDDNTPRAMVLDLLIDAGIPGYGHRYNLLNPLWTHVACRIELFKNYQYNWIQNFGVK